MLGRTDRRPRLLFLAALLILGALAVGARLAYWQVVRGAELRDLAAVQLRQSVTLPAERGSIYDRSGTVVLATTAYRDRLVAYPAHIPEDRKASVASELATILGLDPAGAQRLRAAVDGDAEYVVLAAQLTGPQSDAVSAGLDAGRLVGMGLDPQPVRVYPGAGGAPDTTLASRLLGFVNRDGEGQYGIEQRYQAALAGRSRVVIAPADVSGRPIAEAEQVVDPGTAGLDLRLTVDAGLQLQLERELYAAWVADKAQTVSAVVMDPHSGAVLAWATVPGYDANDYQGVAMRDPGLFVDPIVSSVYEPGSVMKMFVAAAAFEAGVVTPRTVIDDSGKLEFGQYVIYDADKKANGPMAFQDGIARSRNVVAARVARMLGPDTRSASAALYGLWDRLGVGRPTGVDTSGEVAGLVVDPSTGRWADVDLANRSFGQGMAVTQLQLAASYSTMVNGGFSVHPYLVADIGGEAIPEASPEAVLDPSLSRQLTDLLIHVVTSVPFYLRDTHIPGYLVGGKSGTAEIWDAETGDWADNLYNFSFVGFVGRNGPDAVIAVRIGSAAPRVIAQSNLWLPITSWALFRRVAVDTIDALGIRPNAASERRDVRP
jgi:cell division protein FtsI (penicillin-binding protein 3)